MCTWTCIHLVCILYLFHATGSFLCCLLKSVLSYSELYAKDCDWRPGNKQS